MALSDTAALVASLTLKDQFSRTADTFDRRVAGMERGVSSLGRIGSQVGQGLGTAAANIGRIGLIGVGVLGANVAAGIRSLQRLEEVNAATNAVIESTAGVAGVTAEKVRLLAEKFEGLNSTMDDKVIQSGENLLLTFTNITEKAFEPALEAALNMNQALGGGEDGLQNNVIMVGKALQDPIRGLTALRRVGVNFTRQQEDQIRALVESNDLYGAQQIIIGELGREFGGQFAAAGTTATAKFAKFKDVIEDAQMALATAFLPALVKVADKLSTFLADPAVMASIEDVGETLADAFDEVVEIAGNLPWSSIGDAFRLMGTGSKALLDAFVGLPPWVQTAVLTGWGLNKLTGGALTGIAGTLLSSLVKGVLGINAGVVNITAGTVTGGAPGTGAAGGGGLVTGLVGGAAIGGTVIGGISAIDQISSGTEEGVKGGFAALSSGPAGLIAEAIESVIGDPLGDIADGAGKTAEESTKMVSEGRGNREAQIRFNQQRAAEAARAHQALIGSVGLLQGIKNKPDPSFTFNNSTTVIMDGRKVAATITKKQMAVGRGFQPFFE